LLSEAKLSTQTFLKPKKSLRTKIIKITNILRNKRKMGEDNTIEHLEEQLCRLNIGG